MQLLASGDTYDHGQVHTQRVDPPTTVVTASKNIESKQENRQGCPFRYPRCAIPNLLIIHAAISPRHMPADPLPGIASNRMTPRVC
ncbi:hypothetical protein ACRALDRAFT_206365 [Sodiomyces alcalophilus JCM 7366]|uniref:uncharacterized protein n=1 Tax=Sodiomyces alcalophilus JCM 7366 TaxID=591952 RepID=UPI0039B4DE8F